jgi:hypothetical protein
MLVRIQGRRAIRLYDDDLLISLSHVRVAAYTLSPSEVTFTATRSIVSRTGNALEIEIKPLLFMESLSGPRKGARSRHRLRAYKARDTPDGHYSM